MNSDRDWMYDRKIGGLMVSGFKEKVQEFIDFAKSHPECMDGNKIKCPCNRFSCRNKPYLEPDVVAYHIVSKGFKPNYHHWFLHGESMPQGGYEATGSSTNTCENRYENDPNTYQTSPRNYNDENMHGFPGQNVPNTHDRYRDMVMDAAGPTFQYPPSPSNPEPPNPNAEIFYKAMREQETWLDPKQQEISERNAKNRRCGSEDLEAPAPASHTGGSKPHHVHVEDKTNLSGGVFPKHIDMYIALHKQKNNGDDHYNSRVNGIITEFNRRKEEDEALVGSINIDETPHLPIDENKLFVDAIGPPRKGRWRGSETQTSLTPIGGFPTPAAPIPMSQLSEDRIYERVITTVKETLLQIEAKKASTICEDATRENDDTANYDDEEWIGTDDETMMDDGLDMAMDNNDELDEGGARGVESTIGVDDNQFFVNLMADNPLLQNN